MNKRRGCLTSLVWLSGGLLAGVVLGILIGWVFWPVNYVDTDIVDLRAGYQDDYILMVSDAYYLDGDLAEAQRRLANLAGTGVNARIVALIKGKMLAGQPPEELAAIVTLAQGLHVETQDMLDYIATSTPTATRMPQPTVVRTATIPTHTPAVVVFPSVPPVSSATLSPSPSPTTEMIAATATISRELALSAPELAATAADLTAVPPLTVEPPATGVSRSPDFTILTQRMMGKVEVGGCEAPAMIYVKTVDAQGKLVDGIIVQAFWDGGKFEPVVTGSKGPGTAEIVASSGDYYVEIIGNVSGADLTSERSRLLRTAYPSVADLLEAGYCESLDAHECELKRDQNALCGGHYSYELYFRRNG